MRRLRFIPALLVVLSASCSKNIIEQSPSEGPDEVGTVAISLAADMQNEVIGTRADSDEPNLDDFRVAIYKVKTQMRLYNDSYANTIGRKISLNAGEYRLVAQHGDTLGCGFDKPYYLADPTFTVEAGTNTVEAVAKLANVKLAVSFDESVSGSYSDYYAVVRHNAYTSKNIRFSKTETRCGYIPAGELVLEVYADVDGTWKYYKTDVLTYQPNDFVTFSVTTDDREGSLVLNIKVDTSVDTTEDVIEIPAYTVPQEAPEITLSGFDASGNAHEFVEGVSVGANAMASFVARGSIAHCYLTVDSDWLKDRGVTGEYDFAKLTTDQKAVLKNVGFSWDEGMYTSRNLSYIDFSNVIQNMLASVKAAKEPADVASFSLKVVDGVGKEISEDFRIVSLGVNPTMEIADYNVWAKKVVSPVATIDNGDASLVKMQLLDGTEWLDMNLTPSVNGKTVDFGTLQTASNTTYKVRAIYNGNTACVSDEVTVTTEAEQQVGNSGFEEFQCKDFEYTPQAGSKTSVNWYLPWADEGSAWWDVNSRRTLRTNPTVAYQNYKCYPTVTYIVEGVHGGGKSAQIASVSTGQAASEWAKGTAYAGELFIGKSNTGHQDDWNYAYTGHAFASRPSVLKFWYQYEAYEGDSFYVKVEVRDASGNVIASAEKTDGSAASGWTECAMNIPYAVTDAKAGSIFITFKSSTDSSPATEKRKLTFYDSDGENHYVGSVLRVDDIVLEY
ncbi:MAG: DUF4493 domain-containing protein [Bacteroidales bacterium]|nr:DUF4493 domain-containing protein [Bacteroidales bacterium]